MNDETQGLDPDRFGEMFNSFAENLKRELIGALKPTAANTKGLIEDLATYKSRIQELESSDLSKKLRELEEANNRLASEKNNTETTYKKQLHSMLKSNVVTQALARHQGSIRVLEKQLLDRLDVVDVDGRSDVVVLDAKGQPVTFDGKPATIDDLIEEYKKDEEFAFAFKSVKKSGAGLTAEGNTGGDTGDNPFITGDKAAQYALYKTDRSKFERLKSQAQSKGSPA